ncbi:MAG: SRPBCC domain-containing protein [Thermoanaerobaculia bacterium]|nr:SRPBCC domain-containing protein [Thermoanaerobaculia bacterium]
MRVPIRQGDIPGVQLRQERQLEAPRLEVWRWLTEPARLERWLAEEVEALGGSEPGWRLVGTDEVGAPLIESARQESLESGRRWVLVFRRDEAGWESATRLTFELAGDERCTLTVLQQGFERLSLSRCLSVWEQYRHRWRGALDRLEEALAVERSRP